MGIDRGLSLALGALAVSSEVALLTFDVLFSVSLSSHSPRSGVKIITIVASGLIGLTIISLSILIGRQFRYRNGSHIQDSGSGRQFTYLVAGFGGVVGLIGAGFSVAGLLLSRGEAILPSRVLGASVKHLIAGGIVVWAIALVSLAVFIICIVVIQRRDFQQQIQPYRSEVEGHSDAAGQSLELPSTPESNRGAQHKEKSSVEYKSPPASSHSSRSDTMTSVRSSFSHTMRPATSKTKLINKSPYRGASMDSYPESTTTIDDGFDSWDTSTVDAQSRHAVESASPTPPRFLETIPASPTGSRSPSPGFPLDLQPPKNRRRSRSFSPATSYKDLSRPSRATSPESPNQESHIHPLFRTDSPTPPPAATPGTIVTAAPGNGLLISDRQSIRSLARMRSGSLPTTPLVHSASLDSIRFAIEREERERAQTPTEDGGERTLTPPIPDFVLHGTPRNSMQGYAKRKISARGLNKVGEETVM